MQRIELKLIQNENLFSPISQVHYEIYENTDETVKKIQMNTDVQCIIGKYGIDFGLAQQPELMDYADGVDTMDFLSKL